MTLTESTPDKVLDRSLVGGYTSLGYRLRSRTWSEDDPGGASLVDKRVLVTGAGGGLGEAAALGMARLGATVHLVVRSPERAVDAVNRIEARMAAEGLSARLVVDVCDVADLTDVRRYAAELVTRDQPIDVLVHNAGVMPDERTESVDGHELTVATHVLGPVLLTDLALPVLSGHDARVVLVSSGGMYAQKLPADDPDFEDGKYAGASAYARSKRMQVALMPVLQRRWAEAGVSVHAMHPGWADTPGVATSLPVFRAITKPFLRDTEQGADTIVWLAATQPAPLGGSFWHDRVKRPVHYRSGTVETPEQLAQAWDWVRTATGLE